MNKFTFLFCLVLLIGVKSEAQQSTGDPFVYSRILTTDSASKAELYDKALIWCSKTFTDSKSAINVKDKESGIIGGKALFNSYYKVPKKKDSIISSAYSEYLFDWLMEIKDGKLRFSLKNLFVRQFSGDYPVMIGGKPPLKFAFTSEKNNQLEWDLAKAGFLNNIDILINTLHSDLVKNDNW